MQMQKTPHMYFQVIMKITWQFKCKSMGSQLHICRNVTRKYTWHYTWKSKVDRCTCRKQIHRCLYDNHTQKKPIGKEGFSLQA
jgi:hypothetical protein